LWEIFSFGKTPYPAMSNSETFERISIGYRLPAPEDCPEHIFHIMMACWQKDPESRPRFRELYTKLSLLQTKIKEPEAITQNDTGEFYVVSEL
jgi:hypothetical protein